MNTKFVLLDKNNNVEKNAQMIVKFNFDEKNYLVYSVEENEQNSQIFVSKLILNSEGNYFIDDISSDEKGKLSNIVYNIVILLPSDNEKGNDFQTLVNNLFSKFSVKLLGGLPNLSIQEYLNNCSIAITNKTLVDNAIKLYNDKLNIVKENIVSEVPMWTAPLEVTAPIPIDVGQSSTTQEPTIVSSSIPVIEPVVSNLSLNNTVEIQDTSVPEQPVDPIEKGEPSLIINEPVATSETTEPDSIVVTTNTMDVNTSSDIILPDSQIEKIAIVSDPSLGIGIQQPNVVDQKKAGFANTKYVVLGTICLVLAIGVVVAAYFLIKNIS